MSVETISKTKFALIKDLDDLKEFYKIMKSNNFTGEIKCLHVPNGRVKTITNPRFAGPVNIVDLNGLKYIAIKYTEHGEEKKIKIEIPEKNKPFINKYYYSKNKNGGSRKSKKTRKTGK
jgi:hypothetical protein